MSDSPPVIVTSAVHRDDHVIYVSGPVRAGWLLIDGHRVFAQSVNHAGEGPYWIDFRPAVVGRAIPAGTQVTEAPSDG